MKTYEVGVSATVYVRVKVVAAGRSEAIVKACQRAKGTYDSIHKRHKPVQQVSHLIAEDPMLLFDHSHRCKDGEILARIAKRVATREAASRSKVQAVRPAAA